MSNTPSASAEAPTRIIKLPEFCKQLGICRQTAVRLIKRGQVPGARKLGNQWFITWPLPA